MKPVYILLTGSTRKGKVGTKVCRLFAYLPRRTNKGHRVTENRVKYLQVG